MIGYMLKNQLKWLSEERMQLKQRIEELSWQRESYKDVHIADNQVIQK